MSEVNDEENLPIRSIRNPIENDLSNRSKKEKKRKDSHLFSKSPMPDDLEVTSGQTETADAAKEGRIRLNSIEKEIFSFLF